MTKPAIGGIVAAGAAVACVAFVVVLLLLKALWAWTIPDLFPGAVEQGLVAGTISWVTAVKLALFIAILTGLSGSRHARETE